MMKKVIVSLLAATASAMSAWACTSLIAAKGATADGSVMVTYAADSHNLYGELYTQPAADNAPGTMRKVVEWDTGKPLGEIEEVAHTYATVGNMNEHGLVIAESTWGGREELAGSGLIDYGSLIYITLQRAKTAREAIGVIVDLANTYGYAPTLWTATATPRRANRSPSATPMKPGSWNLSAKGRPTREQCGWHAACPTG